MPATPAVRTPVLFGLVIGLPVAAVAVLLIVGVPDGGPLLAALFAVGLLVAAGAALLLYRRPWLAPWGALFLFATSAELRLRLTDTVGVAKDAYVLLLLALMVAHVVTHRPVLGRLRPIAGPLAALGVVVGLYLLDPAGGHGTSWIFGTRLLLEVVALLLIGLLCAAPERTMAHLVTAMTVLLPLQAVFAWAQQFAGADALVFGWGYQYGAQIRATTDGGLRTSGTFEDPFQLAALAVIGLALALFVASRRQAVVLVIAAVAVLGATNVRTALIQAGVLLLIWAARRGWWRQAAVLGALAAVTGVYLLAGTSTAVRPGAPEEPLLLTLNGRSTAWAQAVQGPESFLVGNGVGARGIGSTRQAELVSAAPAYDPNSAPPASFAGDPAFLDSAYAQVQSDVGITGSIAFIGAFVGFGLVLARRCRDGTATAGPAWAALGVLAISMVDWIGRSSVASYTTGFLTLYILGVLVAASVAAPGGGPARWSARPARPAVAPS